MRPAVDEALELVGGARGVARASERLALPEDDVARQARRQRALQHQAERAQGVLVTPDAVARQPEAEAAPEVERDRHRPRQQRGEGVARARGVTQAQGRPAAAEAAPTVPNSWRRSWRDLAEQPVGLLDPAEPVVGLRQPVARLDGDLALGARSQRRSPAPDGVVVFALLEAGAPALERLRGRAGPRPDAGQRARRLRRRHRLAPPAGTVSAASGRGGSSIDAGGSLASTVSAGLSSGATANGTSAARSGGGGVSGNGVAAASPNQTTTEREQTLHDLLFAAPLSAGFAGSERFCGGAPASRTWAAGSSSPSPARAPSRAGSNPATATRPLHRRSAPPSIPSAPRAPDRDRPARGSARRCRRR